ncbi:hypothetical protein AB5N19_06672 [Seiridium cardinale]
MDPPHSESSSGTTTVPPISLDTILNVVLQSLSILIGLVGLLLMYRSSRAQSNTKSYRSQDKWVMHNDDGINEFDADTRLYRLYDTPQRGV